MDIRTFGIYATTLEKNFYQSTAPPSRFNAPLGKVCLSNDWLALEHMVRFERIYLLPPSPWYLLLVIAPLLKPQDLEARSTLPRYYLSRLRLHSSICPRAYTFLVIRAHLTPIMTLKTLTAARTSTIQLRPRQQRCALGSVVLPSSSFAAKFFLHRRYKSIDSASFFAQRLPGHDGAHQWPTCAQVLSARQSEERQIEGSLVFQRKLVDRGE